jgi:FkbM family methyltransferase
MEELKTTLYPSFSPQYWMGTYSENESYCIDEISETTHIVHVAYSPGEENRFCEVYWVSLDPASGLLKDHFIGKTPSKITFMAKGDKGGEFIKAGVTEQLSGVKRGITNSFTLTNDWQLYEFRIGSEIKNHGRVSCPFFCRTEGDVPSSWTIKDIKIDWEITPESKSHTLALVQKTLNAIGGKSFEISQNRTQKSLEPPSRLVRFLNKQLSKFFNLKLISQHDFHQCETLLYYDQDVEWNFTMLFNSVVSSYDLYDKLYYSLADDESKKIFDWFISFRICYLINHKLVRTLFPTPHALRKDDDNYEHEFSKAVDKDGIISYKDYKLATSWYEFHNTWLRTQYAIKGKCEPMAGDIVISGGAFHGETSVWFADKVKATGRVYAFEPSEQNRKNLLQNISMNGLEQIIIPVPCALYNENKMVNLAGEGNCSGITTDGNTFDTRAITLDTFMDEQGLEKIDFIKMDIEGAERSALRGAEQTIITYKPKLAICVYHLTDDLLDIATYIQSLVPEYKIYLSHKNEWWPETVLFASL